MTRLGPKGLPADFTGITRCAGHGEDAPVRPCGSSHATEGHARRRPRSARSATMDFMQDEVVDASARRRIDLRLFGLQPKHRVQQAHLSINDELVGRLNTGVWRGVPVPLQMARVACARGRPDLTRRRTGRPSALAVAIPLPRRSRCGPTFASSRRTASCLTMARNCKSTPSSWRRATTYETARPGTALTGTACLMPTCVRAARALCGGGAT